MPADGLTWTIAVLAVALVLLLMSAAIYVAWLRHGAPRDEDGGAA